MSANKTGCKDETGVMSPRGVNVPEPWDVIGRRSKTNVSLEAVATVVIPPALRPLAGQGETCSNCCSLQSEELCISDVRQKGLGSSVSRA